MSPRTVMLVPHTHWDREWYEPHEAFRVRLVAALDRVLDLVEAEEEFRFTLDGQSAAVEDYLAVRPEARDRVRAACRTGRLALGPWHILLDEFCCAGETIVRNLELGRTVAEDLGGAMPVGHLPDMFGHIAQMPQILAGFGIAHACLWRGAGAGTDFHAFTWRAPDGTAVRVEYLFDGYANALDLFDQPGDLAALLREYVARTAPWWGADPVLGMLGSDHTAPAPDLMDRVRATRTALTAGPATGGTPPRGADADLTSRVEAAPGTGGPAEPLTLRVGTLWDYLRLVAPPCDAAEPDTGPLPEARETGMLSPFEAREPGTDPLPEAREPGTVPLPEAQESGTVPLPEDRESGTVPLPEVRGELRSHARGNLLPGVLSVRVNLKAAMARAERALEEAEAMEALYGEGDHSGVLALAWRRVIEASAHDSITGCGSDATADQVAARLAAARQGADAVRRAAEAHLARCTPSDAVVVTNPLPYPRRALVEVDVEAEVGRELRADLPDGSHAPIQDLGARRPETVEHDLDASDLGLVLRRIHGRELYGNLIESWSAGEGHLDFVTARDPRTVFDLDRLRAWIDRASRQGGTWRVSVTPRTRRRVLVEVPVPALGHTALRVAPADVDTSRPSDVGSTDVRSSEVRSTDAEPPGAPAPVRVAAPDADPERAPEPAPERASHPTVERVAQPVPSAVPGEVRETGAPPSPHLSEQAGPTRTAVLDNGLVRVGVDADGTARVAGLDGTVLSGVGRLVDEGDRGDAYNFGPMAGERPVDRPCRVRVTVRESGPLRGVVQVERIYRLPESMAADPDRRSHRTVEQPVSMRLELRRGEPFLRMRIDLTNRAADHRLRLHVPTGTPAAGSQAGGGYAVTSRGLQAEGGWGEYPLATFPTQEFVSAGSAHVLLDQVTEYEVVDASALALTLVRSVGFMSVNVHPLRDEPAAAQLPVPGAQYLYTPVTRHLAILPHAGSWREARAPRWARVLPREARVVPGTGTPGGPLPEPVEGIGLEGEAILGSLRTAGGGLEARVISMSDDVTHVRLTGLGHPAHRVDLAGKPVPGPDGRNPQVDCACLHLEPWGILTLRAPGRHASGPTVAPRRGPSGAPATRPTT